MISNFRSFTLIALYKTCVYVVHKFQDFIVKRHFVMLMLYSGIICRLAAQYLLKTV